MATAEYYREWRKKNPASYKASKARYNAKPENRQKARDYDKRMKLRSPIRFMVDLAKAAPCTDCGQRYPGLVMEFDHNDASKKTADVAVLVHKRKAPSVVSEEIAKCDLVCANCHRLRTLNRHLDNKVAGTNATTLPPS